MGFFVAESNHDLKNKIYDVWYEQNDDNEGWYEPEFAEFRKSKVKENTKNKCIEFNNCGERGIRTLDTVTRVTP